MDEKNKKEKNEVKTRVYRKSKDARQPDADANTFRTKVARELTVERMMSRVRQEELAERLGTKIQRIQN